MNVSSRQVEKLLLGQYVFKQFSFSMFLTRLKNDYAAAPTKENLEHCVSEINMFLAKYQAIMADDYASMQNI